MRTITEQSELAEFLFEVLTESEPLQKVNASFLLRMTGICYSLIHGGLYGERDYMEDIIAFHWERRTPLLCGTKLVALAQSLAAEGCFDPDRVRLDVPDRRQEREVVKWRSRASVGSAPRCNRSG